MNTKFTIKNFRVFDEQGVSVNIKPITVLTGCNSSGKSSIVKSMVLLNTYINSLIEDFKAYKRVDLNKHKLDFSQDTTYNLGNFSRVIHKGSEDNTITFEYTIHPLILGEDIIISLEFESDKNDVLCQGYIKAITLKKISGDVIYSSSKKNPVKANYNLLINNFFRFVYGQIVADLYDKIKYDKYAIYGHQTEEEFHESLKGMPSYVRIQEEEKERYLKFHENLLEEYYNSFVSAYGEESLHEIETWMLKKGKNRMMNIFGFEDKKTYTLLDKWTEGETDIIDTSLKYRTFFYFPLLEKLYNIDSKSFKNYLLQLINGKTDAKEIILAIDKIAEDFIASKKKTFGDYFEKKESDCLKFSLKLSKSEAPSINGTHYLKLRIHDIYEGYLNWSKRMLGPTFKELEGNLVSLKGMDEKEKWEKCTVDFALLYDVLMNINCIMDDTLYSSFYSPNEQELDNQYHTFDHHLFKMFMDYASMVIEEAVTVSLPQNLSYVATSLVNVKREYSFDSNDSFTNLVKRYFVAQRDYKNSIFENFFSPNEFISRWIEKLGIGHSISINISESGSSFVVRLYKDENDSVGTILAEEGYGITQIVTLLIRIETAILESAKLASFAKYNIPHYSVLEPTIAIEDPEVHLHPMFQSLLAEMFADAFKSYHVHFIIETHSEYLIRKLQTLVAKHELETDDISIIYVYNADISKRPIYTPQIKEIGVQSDGRLDDSFGEGFYDEADRLSMSLLNIKVNNDEKE